MDNGRLAGFPVIDFKVDAGATAAYHDVDSSRAGLQDRGSRRLPASAAQKGGPVCSSR
jgi:translation elongation factor EF-G